MAIVAMALSISSSVMERGGTMRSTSPAPAVITSTPSSRFFDPLTFHPFGGPLPPVSPTKKPHGSKHQLSALTNQNRNKRHPETASGKNGRLTEIDTFYPSKKSFNVQNVAG